MPERPLTLPFHDFKQQFQKNPRDYFCKSDGFHIFAKADPYGKVLYTTKAGTPLATGTTCPYIKHPSCGKILRAINSYLESLPDEDRVDPQRVERLDVRKGGVAYQVHFEFCCVRKSLISVGGGGVSECLQDLFHGKCLNADGTLNTIDYEYPIKIFDALFKANVPIFARVEAVANYYGPEMTANQIFNFKELLEVLNGFEGVVAHEVHSSGSGFRKDKCLKIKVPCPIAAEVVGVQNTLGGDFQGWNKILVCVRSKDCFMAVFEIDLTEILTDHTRPSKGKVYANPKCVKHCPVKGTVVYELANGAKSTSAIAPMLNALYGLIGKSVILPAIKSSSTEAKIRVVDGVPSTVLCGRNRSFSLSGYDFLAKPFRVVMGVNDIWLLANDELHLQAASVLCLPAVGFGPAEYMDMPPTNEATLRVAAEQRLCRNRVEYYELVGMENGPFHGLAEMKDALFCAY
jgi:hypothetical protein